jgi:hypothetical protein
MAPEFERKIALFQMPVEALLPERERPSLEQRLAAFASRLELRLRQAVQPIAVRADELHLEG